MKKSGSCFWLHHLLAARTSAFMPGRYGRIELTRAQVMNIWCLENHSAGHPVNSRAILLDCCAPAGAQTRVNQAGPLEAELLPALLREDYEV